MEMGRVCDEKVSLGATDFSGSFVWKFQQSSACLVHSVSLLRANIDLGSSTLCLIRLFLLYGPNISACHLSTAEASPPPLRIVRYLESSA